MKKKNLLFAGIGAAAGAALGFLGSKLIKKNNDESKDSDIVDDDEFVEYEEADSDSEAEVGADEEKASSTEA